MPANRLNGFDLRAPLTWRHVNTYGTFSLKGPESGPDP